MDIKNNVSLIIKTFKRRDTLRRLLDSIIEQGYDELPILIADDSENPYRDEILKKYNGVVDYYITLPFDVGISKGRNELLKKVDTEYFVLNDDDYVYGEITKIEEAVYDLESIKADILCGYYVNRVTQKPISIVPEFISEYAGIVSHKWKKEKWVANIHETNDGGILIKSLSPPFSPIQKCDIGLNFFVARTDSVWNTVGGWTEELKTQEHWDFFYRCKNNDLDVVFSDNFGVYHIQESSNGYDEYRFGRRDKMIKRSLEMNGIQYVSTESRYFHV
jgi:glycosyltransferase involved in cell wall biosynthesis